MVVIQGKTSFAGYAFMRTAVPYSTVPITSGYTEGLKILFRPVCLSKRDKSVLQRYTVRILS